MKKSFDLNEKIGHKSLFELTSITGNRLPFTTVTINEIQDF